MLCVGDEIIIFVELTPAVKQRKAYFVHSWRSLVPVPSILLFQCYIHEENMNSIENWDESSQLLLSHSPQWMTVQFSSPVCHISFTHLTSAIFSDPCNMWCWINPNLSHSEKLWQAFVFSLDKVSLSSSYPVFNNNECFYWSCLSALPLSLS